MTYRQCPKHSSNANKKATINSATATSSRPIIVDYCRKHADDFPYMEKQDKCSHISWVCGKPDILWTRCECAKCLAARKKHPSVSPNDTKKDASINATEAEEEPEKVNTDKKVRSTGTVCITEATASSKLSASYNTETGSSKRHLLKVDSCSNMNISP